MTRASRRTRIMIGAGTKGECGGGRRLANTGQLAGARPRRGAAPARGGLAIDRVGGLGRVPAAPARPGLREQSLILRHTAPTRCRRFGNARREPLDPASQPDSYRASSGPRAAFLASASLSVGDFSSMTILIVLILLFGGGGSFVGGGRYRTGGIGIGGILLIILVVLLLTGRITI